MEKIQLKKIQINPLCSCFYSLFDKENQDLNLTNLQVCNLFSSQLSANKDFNWLVFMVFNKLYAHNLCYLLQGSFRNRPSLRMSLPFATKELLNRDQLNTHLDFLIKEFIENKSEYKKLTSLDLIVSNILIL